MMSAVSDRSQTGLDAQQSSALEGVVVVELGQRVAAGACGSLLAQLGATVVVVEPSAPHGGVDKWRNRAQFLAGKMSLVPDLNDAEDRGLLESLLARADVVVHSSDRDLGALTELLSSVDDEAVVCDITAFGDEGPLSGRGGSDAEVQAMTGILYTTGLADGPPVSHSTPILEYLTSVQAAGAVLLALHGRRTSGHGQSIDMALYDCGFAAMSSFFSRLLGPPADGVPQEPTRLGNLHPLSAPWNVYCARDGWVLICTGSNGQWGRLCELMARAELEHDPRFIDSAHRVVHVGQVDRIVQEWVGGQTVAHCVEVLGRASIPAGPIVQVEGFPNEDNLIYRGMVQRLTGARDGEEYGPGSPFRMSRSPGKHLTHVPVPDADRPRIAALAHVGRGPCRKSGDRANTRPLADLVVIEIGHYTTAPVGARCLGAFGADVIKVEPPGGEAARGWNPIQQGQSVFYTISNSDKRCVVVDLGKNSDLARVRTLLAAADVLIENLKPGSLLKYGLSYEAISAINPRLIYCAISGFGAYSLYERRAAFDTVVQGMSGLMSLAVSQGMPLKTGISYADVMGAASAVAAILAALEYRHRSGMGQYIDLSMQDIVAWSTQMAWNGRAGSTGDGQEPIRIPARTPAQVLACAHTEARRLYFTVNDHRGAWPVLAVPLRLLGTPPAVLRPGPELGRHNDIIFGSLGAPAHKHAPTIFPGTRKTMNYENLQITHDGPAFIMTVHRPKKRNALSMQTIDEISDAVRRADGDPAVRGMILTGGPEFFSAGADLNEALGVESVADGDAFFGRANRLCALMEASSKPIIAAIEGFCITGGIELAMACDIRVGGKGSSYAITSSRIGTVAGFGGTQRLPRLVGSADALDILFSAEPIDAERAYRIGLITRLVEKGAALDEAKRMIRVYEKRGPISLAFAKRAVYRGTQMDLYSGVDFEYSLVTSIYSTADKQEGVSAFLEKREAQFTGR